MLQDDQKVKQKYIAVEIIEEANPMTKEEAIDAGYIKEDYEGEAEGMEITRPNGSKSWVLKASFDAVTAPFSEKDEKALFKVKDSLAQEIGLAVKVRGHIEKIEDKKWSLKEFASQILKTYKIEL